MKTNPNIPRWQILGELVNATMLFCNASGAPIVSITSGPIARGIVIWQEDPLTRRSWLSDSGLHLYDQEGNLLVDVSVDPKGVPALTFMKKNGDEVYRIPPKNVESAAR
jgi:hypothetical protein